jgi:glutathionyl-hydroquinone reductase
MDCSQIGQASVKRWVKCDGRPGLSGSSGFKGESGRYHLYVSLACPWAHRTLIVKFQPPELSVRHPIKLLLTKEFRPA